MKFIRPLVCASFMALPLFGQSGGLVSDQPTLAGILGASSFTQNFQAFTLPSGTALTFSGVNTIDSTTVVDSQGPSLVNPGISFAGTSVQFDAENYFNAPATELLFNAPTITINFTNPTTAFGLDVRDFSGYSAGMTVNIYAADNKTVLYTTSSLTIADPAIFFGYRNSGGIGMVTLTNLSSNWSPIIEDVTFEPVPEPSTWVLLLLGAGMLLGYASCRINRLQASC